MVLLSSCLYFGILLVNFRYTGSKFIPKTYNLMIYNALIIGIKLNTLLMKWIKICFLPFVKQDWLQTFEL
jgi:hypothetical protein